MLEDQVQALYSTVLTEASLAAITYTHVKETILNPPGVPIHQLNTTEESQLIAWGSEESFSGALPKFLTHKIMRYNKMMFP